MKIRRCPFCKSSRGLSGKSIGQEMIDKKTHWECPECGYVIKRPEK